MMSLGFTPEEIQKASTYPESGAGQEPSDLPTTLLPPGDSTPPMDVSESAFNSSEVHTLAKTSLDFLAALAMPLVFKYLFPTVFKAVWEWLLLYVSKSRDFSQLALGLPRGFGKTMLMKLFILYCILFTSKKFILIISETAQKAINILADITDALEEPNIKRVFGDWKLGIETDTQALKKFGFRGRNIILMAAGAGTGIRGITIKNERPDVMLFDDIQSRECAESQIQSEALESWMVGTAMKAKSPHGCLFLFVANMYPTKWSILRKLKANPNWIKFIAGGILADGTSLWEDLQPISQLIKEFENDLSMGHPEIFFAEVLNDETASSNNFIDLSKLPVCPFQEDEISAGNFIIIDPATDKPGADAVSIGYFEIHNTLPVMKELIEDRLSPGDTIREAVTMALRHNCRLVVIESNAYQYSLNYWFKFIVTQMGIIGIDAVEIYSGVKSKNSRILEMFKALLAGEIYIHESCKAACHLQIAQFNPLKRDNTDGLLDLLTYAPRVIELYGEYVMSMGIIEDQELSQMKVLENNSVI
jgi:hypothetical protein